MSLSKSAEEYKWRSEQLVAQMQNNYIQAQRGRTYRFQNVKRMLPPVLRKFGASLNKVVGVLPTN
jgi:hypothetical protein